MGVHGLWQLLQPTGRPVTLESLSDKVLAVDVSMWLHQLMKGMRDRHGNSLPNAHLIGLYHRVCKLLYYRVKPVFVFDGGVPILKKQTLASRRQKQDEASQTADDAAKKLLANLMKQNALNAVLGASTSSTADLSLKRKPAEKDVFELPPLPQEPKTEQEEAGFCVNSDTENNDEWTRMDDHLSMLQNVASLDMDSEDFKALPPDVRHEMLSELKESRKKTSWSKFDSLPKEASDFSGYQISKLLKQSRLSERINNTRKEMVKQTAGDVTSDLLPGSEVESQRILSEDSAHYILIHGISKTDDIVKKVNYENNTNSQVAIERSADNQSRSKNEFPQGHTSQTSSATELKRKKPKQKGKIKSKQNRSAARAVNDNLCLSSDSDDLEDKVKPLTKVKVDPDHLLTFQSDDESELAHVLEEPLSLVKAEVSVKKDDVKDSVIQESPQAPLRDEEPDILQTPKPETEETTDDEDSFLEVVVDTSNIKADELFPPSIFTTSTENVSSGPVPLTTIIEHDEEPAAPEVTAYLQDDEQNSLEEVEENNEELEEEKDNEFIQEEVVSDSDENEMSRDERDFLYAAMADSGAVQDRLSEERRSLQREHGQQERAAMSITDKMHAEAEELLALFGVPFIRSPMEAEAQCAKLDELGLVDGTVTDDSDVWLFGGKHVFRNVFNQNRHVELYRYEDIARQLLLDRTQLINIALLCGSDYTSGIPGVGPVTAMEIMAEFPGEGLVQLDRFKSWWLDSQKKVKVTSETKVKSKLRKLSVHEGFPNPAVAEAYINPAVDDSEEKFSWSIPDLDLLRQYARDKFGWQQERADESLLPVMKQITSRQTQSRITSYFPTEFTEQRTLKSKRVKRVLNVMKTASPEKRQCSPKGKTPLGKPSKIKSCKAVNLKSGGFVADEQPTIPQEVDLSESSASDLDQFDLHDDISDDLLRDIDLESLTNGSIVKVKGQGHLGSIKSVNPVNTVIKESDLRKTGLDKIIKKHKGSKMTLTLDNQVVSRKRACGLNTKRGRRKTGKMSTKVQLSESSDSN